MFSDPSSEDFARFELGAGTPILLASVATVVVLVRSRLPPPPVRSSGGTVGRTLPRITSLLRLQDSLVASRLVGAHEVGRSSILLRSHPSDSRAELMRGTDTVAAAFVVHMEGAVRRTERG